MKISIVICTYNRAKFIREALDSLTKQSLDLTLFELIIVNNNCKDNTEEICKDFIKLNPLMDINYVIENNQGLSFARNRGIQEAKYEIITYIDDDAYTTSDFLEIIYNHFNENPLTDAVGGKVIPRYETKEPIWMNKYLNGFVTKIDLGDKMRHFTKKEFPIGCNMSYKKEILEKVGGFNNKLKWRADDKYIGLKVHEVSNQLIYLPTLTVDHTIDDYRTSDENFDDLSLKFGIEESIRVRDEGLFSYIKKIIEFIYKLAGSFILMIMFILKGQTEKGTYTFRYRWLAIKGLLSLKD